LGTFLNQPLGNRVGEVEAEVIVLLNDLKDYQVDYVTIGQYLQPSKSHAPIHRFVTLQEFKHYQTHGERLAFKNIGWVLAQNLQGNICTTTKIRN
jgi:lipoate synthase